LLLSVRRTSDDHPLNILDETGQPLGPELPLAEIQLLVPDPPVGAAALPVQVETNADFEESVRLVGYSLGGGPFKSGETMPLTLFWESLVDNPGSLLVGIELKDATGQPGVSYQQEPGWPASEWRQGSILRDPHDVALPPVLVPGQYQLEVSLATPKQGPLTVNGAEQLMLTTVTTIDRPHVFDAPSPQNDLDVNFGDKARLIGLDLPQTHVQPDEPVKLTLYWQAIAQFDKSRTVFVHFTDSEGRLVAQQDQIPGGGQFPTTGWLPGEYLVDSYTLHLPADISSGQYWLKIGLYDANDFSRLPVLESEEIISDHTTLDGWPIFVE
jgi:hypothetical protein